MKILRAIKAISLLILIGACACILSSCGSSGPGGAATTTFPQNSYDFPTDITPSPDGSKLYVANNVRNSITIVEPSSLSVIGEIKTSCAPRHIALNAAGTEMYVGHDETADCKLSPLDSTKFSGTKLSIVNVSTGAVTKEINFNTIGTSNLRGMAWNETGDLLYGAALSDEVVIIDTALQTYQSRISITSFTDPIGVDITSDDATVVVASSTDKKLALISTATGAQYSGSPWTISACTKPTAVLISDDDNYAFVSCHGLDTSTANDRVYVYDISDPAAGSADVLGYIIVGDKPTAMALSSDGNSLVVVNRGSGTLYYIPWSSMQAGTGTINGLSFAIGAGASDVALIGDVAYVTDQLSSTIYKVNYKSSSQAADFVSFDAALFAGFPY